MKPVVVQALQPPTEVVRPVIDSPVRSQPQEKHSYPHRTVASGRPPVLTHKASEGRVKAAQSEEVARGFDVDEKRHALPMGFRMKMKLAWMGLKTKAKL